MALVVPCLHRMAVFKLIVTGDSGVGKSALLTRYTRNSFMFQGHSTVGIDFFMHTVTVDGHQVQLHLWDTAGHERFRGLSASYYRGAHAALCVYDVGHRPSFESLGYWTGEAERHLSETEAPIVIVGNKADVHRSRNVPLSFAKDWADSKGYPLWETSCRVSLDEDDTIHRLFESVCRSLLEQSRTLPPWSPLASPPKASLPLTSPSITLTPSEGGVRPRASRCC